MLKHTDRVVVLEMVHSMFERGYVQPYSYFADERAATNKDLNYALMLFLQSVEYIEEIGGHVDFEKAECDDYEKMLFRCDSQLVQYYFDDIRVDISEIKIDTQNLSPEEKKLFGLLNLYFLFRSGATLDRGAIEETVGLKFSHSGFDSLKKEFSEATAWKIMKRQDNLYFIQGDKEHE